MAVATHIPTLRLVTSDGDIVADSNALQGLWTV